MELETLYEEVEKHLYYVVIVMDFSELGIAFSAGGNRVVRHDGSLRRLRIVDCLCAALTLCILLFDPLLV